MSVGSQKSGHILVNEMMETNPSNIYVVGGATTMPAVVYTAAYEEITTALPTKKKSAFLKGDKRQGSNEVRRRATLQPTMHMQ